MTDRIPPLSSVPPDPASDASPGASRCPVCPEAVDRSAATYPFCSARCQSIDLGRWFDESYKVSRPLEQADIEEDD